MKELRVGIAGFGVVGKQRQKSILKIPNIKITAVSDKIFSSDNLGKEIIYLDDYNGPQKLDH